MKRENPPTSIDAYKTLDPAKLRKDYRDIVAALREIKSGTFEQIAKHLKRKPEQVWKRLSEARNLGLVERTTERRQLSSGSQGSVWVATDKLPITESALPGKTIADFSKALIQPTISPKVQQTLF